MLASFITELNLSSNQFKTLPEYLGDFSKLMYLNLGVNMLSSLPQTIGNLPYLRELVISDNRCLKQNKKLLKTDFSC